MRPEIWGGVECTCNRVRDRWFDQIARTGHDHRLDDLDRFAALGIRTLRFPLLWERLAPCAPGTIDWSWADARLARLTSLGMRPIAGLVHHGSGPRYTSLLDPDFPRLLAGYARAIAERYPWIDAYTPINEPLTTARFSALYGHWYPHAASDRAFVRALINELRATVLAMRAVREVNPAAQLVQTEDAGSVDGTPALQAQIDFERHRQWLTIDLLAGRVTRDHPMWEYLRSAGATEHDLLFFHDPLPPDLVGLNYYVTSDRWLDERLDRYASTYYGGNGLVRYADVESVRAGPEGIAGHEARLIEAWNRYSLPLAITEVHLHCTREEQLRWLAESWRAANAASRRGVDVRAVTVWALLGSFDWDSLVTLDRDHYEPGVFDIRAAQPRPTALARMIRQIASGGELSHPVLTHRGWWHQSQGPAVGSDRDPAARPLMVIGARGTLGRAFERVCRMRGLAVRMLSRAELDIADRDAVERTIRAEAPWGVINAAGYVRVDDAECDRESCWRDNVSGAINLAAACRQLGMAFVTFSSDLVFDGLGGRPYTEDDRPAPRNVYGLAKAEAERLVLSLHPDALVVRTSAFFGPWDDHNFAAHVRLALASGQPFRAAADVTVSPTYVPELVHAALDLLIDGEHGVWHLANDSAVTWAAFARKVAVGASLDADLIVECRAADVFGAAPRPSYTPLASRRGRLMRALDAALADYVGALPPVPVKAGMQGCASQ